jgi:glycerate kinase
MRRIVIAPDKFKGSLTGLEICSIIEEELKKKFTDTEIIQLPLADGGDGTVDVFQFYTGGKILKIKVPDPLMRPVDARYLYSKKKKIAFIELAEASGIRLLSDEELNPMKTYTYGTGVIINDAIERGADHIVLGIGGSATNDAGMGMARALGYRFYDKSGDEIKGRGKDLRKLYSIDDKYVNEKLKKVRIEVACDVDNPLYGKNGAAYVYGPQKGASKAMVEKLDEGLKNFSKVIERQFGIQVQEIPGAGAAGGVGAGTLAFLNAELKSGIQIIKDLAQFDEQIINADWIVTGEGKLDEQTFSGKVIKGVIDSMTNQKLAVFCGINERDYENVNIDFISELRVYAKNINDSIKNSDSYLRLAVKDFLNEIS